MTPKNVRGNLRSTRLRAVVYLSWTIAKILIHTESPFCRWLTSFHLNSRFVILNENNKQIDLWALLTKRTSNSCLLLKRRMYSYIFITFEWCIFILNALISSYLSQGHDNPQRFKSPFIFWQCFNIPFGFIVVCAPTLFNGLIFNNFYTYNNGCSYHVHPFHIHTKKCFYGFKTK